MVTKCGICNEHDSKYKCPICEIKYCSLPCYKSHKTLHEEGNQDGSQAKNDSLRPNPIIDRPGTTQRAPKLDFTAFESDKDFQHLLTRFPSLKCQLQLAYGLTLEPGPEDYSWSRRDWFPEGRTSEHSYTRGWGRGRGRGRGRGGRYAVPEIPPEERQRGPWNQEKGDKQALDVLHRMRNSQSAEFAEGMEEFVQLCQLKFGAGR